MEKLNLVKILKNCPKGTKFYSPVYGKIEFIGIETFVSNPDPITIKWFKDKNTTYLEYLRADGTFRGLGECIIFPSEEQRDWSKWQRPFVKGDILVTEAGNIVLCSHIDEKQLVHYHCILNFLGTLKICNDIGVGYSYNCKLANDSQKQKLFDALKKEGYEWDAEKKELKTLQPFKDGDVVTYENQIAIFKKYIFEDSGLAECYVFLDNNLEIDIDGNYYVKDFATEEEKKKLFDVIREKGYRWNTESKTLENWTIQDAKDGDVIFYDDGWTCIFKCIHGIWYSSYCFITSEGEFHTGYETHAVDATSNGNAHRATKEQRNLLFQKIKEAGYKWNPQTKTLVKS